MLGSCDAKFKVYKVRFKWPIFTSVLPVHSSDDGACDEHNLVGAGETIERWSLRSTQFGRAWPSGSLLVGSGPAYRPQGFPSDY